MFRPVVSKSAAVVRMNIASSGKPSSSVMNEFVTPRVLRGLGLMRSPGSSPSPIQFQQRRHATSWRVLNALNKDPAQVVEENFRFQKPHQSERNIQKLQTKLLTSLSDESGSKPAFNTRLNPTAADIESLVEKHGPVRLTLYGLLPKGEGATPLPSEHTVLVTGTCVHQGTTYAIVVDGNDLAHNPIKDAAEAYAKKNGKALHQLNERDYQNINRNLIVSDHGPVMAQAMYRVVDLDRVVDNHGATATKYKNYIETMQRDLELEGVESNIDHIPEMESRAVYDGNSTIGGKLQQQQKDALAELIRNDPNIVEPFIPLQGPAASSDPFHQIPGVEKVFQTRSTAAAWRAPASVQELKDSLKNEPTFRDAIDKPENRQWVNDLYKALQEKPLPKGDRGIEMIMRFKCTYGTVHHLAIGTLWRDQEGNLNTGIHHQEAIPINRKDWEGHVFSTFDTSKESPGGRAPVAESIKLGGMPDLKLLTTRYPDKIVGIAQAMSGADNAYPYGPNESWSDSKWRFPANRPFITCSNTTLDVHDIMRGQYPVHKHTLPDLFKNRIGELNNTDYQQVKKIKVGENDYDLDDIEKLPREIAGAMFAAAGMMWGNHRPWDINAPRDVTSGRIALSDGDNVKLPVEAFPDFYHGATFLNPKNLKTADGESVERNVYFTRAEIEQMTYSAEQPGRLLFVAATDRKSD